MRESNKKEVSVAVVRTEEVQYDRVDFFQLVREAVNYLGNITKFVKPGCRVFIKPNAVSGVESVRGVTTEPKLIGALVRLAFEAGAKEVIVGDSSVNVSDSYRVMKEIGLVTEVERFGGRVIDLDQDTLLPVDIAQGSALRKILLPKSVLDADVIINAPKAKTHMIDAITCCVKNWVGIIPQKYRLKYHQLPRLYQVIADVMTIIRPALCVVDAVVIGEGEGPLNVTPRFLGLVFAGTDPVATDVVVAKVLGFEADELWFPWAAHLSGIGEIDFNKIQVLGMRIDDIKIRARRPTPALYNRFPCNIVTGGVCWGCLTWVIGTFVSWEKEGFWSKINYTLGKPTFLMGFNAEDPGFDEHILTGSYFVIGDCAPEQYKKNKNTIFIPGCPPGPRINTIVREVVERRRADEKFKNC
jgi:uncharacterized protein (DUF362 family)